MMQGLARGQTSRGNKRRRAAGFTVADVKKTAAIFEQITQMVCEFLSAKKDAQPPTVVLDDLHISLVPDGPRLLVRFTNGDRRQIIAIPWDGSLKSVLDGSATRLVALQNGQPNAADKPLLPLIPLVTQLKTTGVLGLLGKRK